jgi:hypothetical protein
VNSIEGTTSCGSDAGASSAEIAKWAADSVVSPGASYDYPLTPLSFWYCSNSPNETTGLGSFLTEQVTSSATVTCAGGACLGEPVWTDPTNFANMVSDMVAGCVPRH